MSSPLSNAPFNSASESQKTNFQGFRYERLNETVEKKRTIPTTESMLHSVRNAGKPFYSINRLNLFKSEPYAFNLGEQFVKKITSLFKSGLLQVISRRTEKLKETGKPLFDPEKNRWDLQKLRENVVMRRDIDEAQKRNLLYQIKEMRTLYVKYEQARLAAQDVPANIPNAQLVALSKEISDGNAQLRLVITALKISDVATPIIKNYKQIAQGKAKAVWTLENSNSVFYTPVKNIFGLSMKHKEREIKEEVQTANQIKANLQDEGTNLALDLEVMKGEERIKGAYTVKTSKALGDLEKELTLIRNGGEVIILPNNEQIKERLGERVEYAQQFLNGMSSLHKAGFVHGDIKLENILVYNSPVENKRMIKISDFGKTRPIGQNEERIYSGNGRYASVDGSLSQRGEVYSSALVIIRLLEEGFLKENQMLIPPAEVDSTMPPNPNRRGIEKFLVMNQHTPQTESSLRGKLKMFSRLFVKREYPLAEREVHRYIDALVASLREKNISVDELNKLEKLLKEMTQSIGSRPSLREAAQRFQNIRLA